MILIKKSQFTFRMREIVPYRTLDEALITLFYLRLLKDATESIAPSITLFYLNRFFSD